MNEFFRPRNLAFFGLWLAIASLTILARLLPLSVPAGSWPGPDIVLAMTMAWVIRRPSQVPAVAIVLVFLAEDLFLMRPPGLWALIVLGGTEFLRRRHAVAREMNLLLEWAMVSAVMVAMLLAYRLGLAIVMTPRPELHLSLLKFVFTVLSYPVVVVVLQSLLRVRKPATGEVDELGRKL